MIKIFVLHYKKLFDRKQFLLSQFQQHGIVEFEFIEMYDLDDGDITETDLLLFDLNDPDFVANKSRISLALKHLYVYKEISEKYENALILEDDVIFHENFVSLLTSYISQLPESYDMLFIGDGCNFHIPHDQQKPNCNVYERGTHPVHWGGDGITRCTDAYVISKKCAREITELVNNIFINVEPKIYKGVDWWLNDIARKKKFIVYWAEPTISSQGSQMGIFYSSNWISF
jgi:GR25 family glycosyltransferase involved in LPS biosynthesis